jgi:peptidoglycan/xylan/chitin deacetylase (PgdA/CDA1 family)
VLPIVAVVVALWLLTQTHETPLVLALVVWIVLAVIAAVRKVAYPIGAVGLVGVLAVGGWIGANSAEVTWFGHQVSHGSRDRQQVAITFDDGPNVGATMAIAHILDDHGAKGTFFFVGKAINARPDITKALYDDGHLVGNHSYNHDSTAWLDPRYPELARTQTAFEQQLGVCPAFYRAPHGQHTPFVARVVHQHHMVMVGWDVSVGDWKAQDPKRLAERVLAKVKPGSIIDLHDGLDGNVDADRTNLVQAMPYLLEGLAARHLTPVRLDVLLDRPGYVTGCGSRRPTSTRAAASGMAAKSMAASSSEVRDR